LTGRLGVSLLGVLAWVMSSSAQHLGVGVLGLSACQQQFLFGCSLSGWVLVFSLGQLLQLLGC